MSELTNPASTDRERDEEMDREIDKREREGLRGSLCVRPGHSSTLVDTLVLMKFMHILPHPRSFLIIEWHAACSIKLTPGCPQGLVKLLCSIPSALTARGTILLGAAAPGWGCKQMLIEWDASAGCELGATDTPGKGPG